MFVNVKGLRVMLERMGYHIRLVNGFMYEPVGGNFYWTPTTLTHYALQAVKTRPLNKGVNFEQRRYLAKPNKKAKLNKPKRPLDRQEMSQVIPYDQYEEKIAAIMSEFKQHLESRLTTRATSAALETLKIQLEGLSEPLELRDLAQISMSGASLIVINLSSTPEAIKPTLTALQELGNLSPQVEVNNIYVPIPRVTREHRENLVSVAKQAANSSKDKLKALFSDFSSKAKRQKSKGGVSDDLIHDTVENLHCDCLNKIEEIESVLKTKTDQLLNQKS